MPIRKSVTSAYSAETKEFNRLMVHGPLPSTPSRKPSAEEREPFIEMLKSIPIYTNMPKAAWIRDWITPFLTTKFSLWGIDLAIYPMSRAEHNETVTCVGVMVLSVTKTRRNITARKSFKGHYERQWYREILDWISEQHFDGS